MARKFVRNNYGKKPATPAAKTPNKPSELPPEITAQPPPKPNGVAVRLDSAEDAEFRYIGNNRTEIQRRFPKDVENTIIAEKLTSRAEEYLPVAKRKITKWHDKCLSGVMKAWDAMDAVLNPTGNYEVHAISFLRDRDSPPTDSNIGWFVSWNTPI